ncbi:hypothetical protein SAMN05216327_105214 [Dyadobacter sp. SG02]|uniref:hypothetical protein n=1 Tax=Dyadobacter sp. SG02 TaxID=1855291 RepID=UPI0008C8ED43|nr:hypothetical protein [Dyadobacter sp. SG02]SEJ00203.1 hypothetical protein SAMN05216327_105214 [Dyadobacter sp. SG02]
MKSSDEQIDEELRKALRERFDNFERLPDPNLREKIFKGLGGGTSMVQTGLVAALLLLITLTAAVYIVSYSLQQKKDMVTNVRQATQAFSEAMAAKPGSEVQEEGQPPAARPIAARPVAARPIAARAVVAQSVVTRPVVARPIAARPFVAREGDVVNAENLGNAVNAGNVGNTGNAENTGNADLIAPKRSPAAAPRHDSPEVVPARTVRATRAVVQPYRYKRADVVKLIEMIRSNPSSFGSLWISDDQMSPADRAFLDSELEKMDFGSAVPDSAENNIKELEGPTLADQDIGVLDHRPMALPHYNWQPDSLITPGEPQKRYEYLFKEHWTFIAGLTPLRTFQILTVRPGNGVVYQNFVLPAKISAATVGYKFSAGVERKGFQLSLNYGQFKQSYRYEIATSEFTVGPDLTGNYQVVRKGIPQEENSTVRLVGMAVKKHVVRRSHFLRDYYGDVGAEYSRDLTSKRNLVWLNAGFGKELFAGNNVAMTVGPYFEYSLSKLRNPDNPFKIQPYQIGLSVGLRYTKK